MKAITIWQPRAQLIALGAVRYHVCWPLEKPYLGEIAIHTAKYSTQTRSYMRFAYLEPPRSILIAAGYRQLASILCQHVIAFARLVDNQPLQCAPPLNAAELVFPDLRNARKSPKHWRSPQRVLRFAHVRLLENPVKVSGQPDVWEWTPPADWRPKFVEPALPFREVPQ